MDDLWKEFESVNKTNSLNFKNLALSNFWPCLWLRETSLWLLTENCDCWNSEVLKALNKSGQTFLDINQILWINVDQFSGIEYEEFPCPNCRSSNVADWPPNEYVGGVGIWTIFCAVTVKNRQTLFTVTHYKIDWESLVSKTNFLTSSEILHSLGSKFKTWTKADMEKIFAGVTGGGTLDYVTAWYKKQLNIFKIQNQSRFFVSTPLNRTRRTIGNLGFAFFIHTKSKFTLHIEL